MKGLGLLSFCNSCRAKGTQNQYKQSLCMFFEVLNNIGVERRSRDHVTHMDSLSIEYLNNPQNHIQDLLQFKDHLEQYSPMTRRMHFNTVVYWLKMNDIFLSPHDLHFIKSRLGKGKTTTKDHALSIEDIKAWYEHLSHIGKVLLLIQISSGMRIGEVLALRYEDINFESEPVEVQVLGTWHSWGTGEVKTGETRYTFISSEASYALKEWLKVRDDWLKTACKRAHGFVEKSNTDDRLIPISHTNLQYVYTQGLKKAGLFLKDQKTNRATISSHSLRKFFSSQLSTVMPKDMVELLMGHAGYLGGAYIRYPKAQVAKEYLKAEYIISIHTGTTPEIRANMDNLKELAQSQASELIKLQMRVDEQQKALEEIRNMNEILP